MGAMPMQLVKSSAVYVSCVAAAVSLSESAATPHMTKWSPSVLLLTHDTIMRSCKPGLMDKWPCIQRYKHAQREKGERHNLQRRGTQRLHFVAFSDHVVTAKVAEHERVAAV